MARLVRQELLGTPLCTHYRQAVAHRLPHMPMARPGGTLAVPPTSHRAAPCRTTHRAPPQDAPPKRPEDMTPLELRQQAAQQQRDHLAGTFVPLGDGRVVSLLDLHELAERNPELQNLARSPRTFPIAQDPQKRLEREFGAGGGGGAASTSGGGDGWGSKPAGPAGWSQPLPWTVQGSQEHMTLTPEWARQLEWVSAAASGGAGWGGIAWRRVVEGAGCLGWGVRRALGGVRPEGRVRA